MSHAWHFVRVQLQGPTHSGLPKTRTRCSGTCLRLLPPNQNRGRVGAVLGQLSAGSASPAPPLTRACRPFPSLMY